jgi:hypothetical protein
MPVEEPEFGGVASCPRFAAIEGEYGESERGID